MKNRIFKKGDRIRIEYIGNSQHRINGRIGTIAEGPHHQVYGVCLDKPLNSHDLGGKCNRNCGIWVHENFLQPFDKESLDYILGLYG